MVFESLTLRMTPQELVTTPRHPRTGVSRRLIAFAAEGHDRAWKI
jgi:hypothetical protein